VAVCVAASGLLTYAYLAVTARALPAAEYATFGAFWSLALVVGMGAFTPLEHEVARLVHLGPPGAVLPRGTLQAMGGLTALVLVGLAAGVPLLLPALGGSTALLTALVVTGLVSGPQYLVRGVLLGRGALGLHGAVVVLDAGLRLVAAAAVARWTGADDAGDFAWTLVAAISLAHLPVLAWLAVRRPARSGIGGPRVRSGDLGHLLVGSVCAQVLLNAAPVLVTATATGADVALAAAFVASFTLVRLPLFVAVPLQGALIPSLTTVAGDRRAVRRLVTRTAAGIAGLSTAGAALGWLAGPLLVTLLFGERYALPGGDMALLAAGSGLYLGLLVTGQALLAAARHRDVAVVWAVGLVTAALVFAAVPALVLRAGLAFTVGSGLAFASGLLVLLRLPAPAPPSPPVPTTPKGDSA
jgi:O-antigen/teichoic acid export membrane protein